MIAKPDKRADTADFFELNYEATAGHHTTVAAPASIVIEIHTIHIEIFTDLLDSSLVARQPFVQFLNEFHSVIFLTCTPRCFHR